MTSDTPLFDAGASKAAADAAVEAVRKASKEWQLLAVTCVDAVARRRLMFTTDHVRAYMQKQGWNDSPPEPRAWGAVMRTAAQRGLCERTGYYAKSDWVAAHGRPKAEWQSAVLGDDMRPLSVSPELWNPKGAGDGD